MGKVKEPETTHIVDKRGVTIERIKHRKDVYRKH